MIYNMSGGGGAGLNFKVVGNPKPGNPSNNTLWLDTDVPVSGWAFCSEVPADLQEGLAIFIVGTSSPAAFSALKKNQLIVYPVSAKQCIDDDGTIVDVTAQMWQDGAWKDLWPANVLIENGKMHPDYSLELSSNINNARAEMTDEGLYIYIPPASNSYSTAFFHPKFDVSGFSALTVVWKSHGFAAVCGLATEIPAAGTSGYLSKYAAHETIANTGIDYSVLTTSVIPLDELTDDLYFAITGASSGASNYSCEILIVEARFT